MTRLFLYKIEKNWRKISQNIVNTLSKEEKDKAKIFFQSKDKNLYIAGKYITRKYVGKFLGVDTDKLIFKSDKYNRPYLYYPKIKNFDFNISHSGQWVVLAISNFKVGVDIERMKKFDYNSIYKFFHKKEIEYLNFSEGRVSDNFYKIWTLKESFIKAIGHGLSYPLKSFYFKFGKNHIKLFTKSKNDWKFKMYKIDKNYKLALCLKGTKKFPKINIITKL